MHPSASLASLLHNVNHVVRSLAAHLRVQHPASLAAHPNVLRDVSLDVRHDVTMGDALYVRVLARPLRVGHALLVGLRHARSLSVPLRVDQDVHPSVNSLGACL